MTNPSEPATKRQLWFLHQLTGEDTCYLIITKEEASKRIGKLLEKREQSRPLVNPHASGIQQDKQLRQQMTYDKTHRVKPGDYYSTSWGYDQTNIDFLVVVEVSPTGKTALCKMASAIHVGESAHEDVLTPGTAYGEAFRMKIDESDGDLRGSYPYCAGHSSKRFGYFSKIQIGETRNETMAQFGH